MLNYYDTTIAYLVVSVVLIISGMLFSTAGIVIILIITLFYVSLSVVASARIQMNFYIKAINRGNKKRAKVALTFDDGPDESTTVKILDILEKHKIKAAFFCIGSRIEKNREIAKKISDRGHIIGNHSWSHAFLFDFYLPGKMVREIEKTDEIIKEITGRRVEFFRPPYGVTNPFLSKAVKKTGHTVLGWSLRTFDTMKDGNYVLKKIESRLSGGDIILLHDTNPQTVEILDDIIKIIKKGGMEIVRLDYLINDDI